MVLVVAAAILGAALGLFGRSAWLAFVFSLILSGSAQYGLIMLSQLMAKRPDLLDAATWIQVIAGDNLGAIWPTLAAAGASCALAAIMLMISRRQEGSDFWLPGQINEARDRRRGVRAASMVEARAIHDQAESRLDKIMRM